MFYYPPAKASIQLYWAKEIYNQTKASYQD